jgi:sulfite reductase (NADPH) flavoprotein alpha-component
LLLGNGGIIFVCILSILLIVFLITGLYLWWPKNNKIWRKATTLNLRHNLKQTCFSLHAWFGVWSSMLILYFSITGLALTKPEWFSPLLSPHIYAPPANAGFEKKCDGHITPIDAEMTARKAFPNKQLATFFLPNEENGPYYLTYKLGSDNNQQDGDGRIFVHSSCSGLVHIETTETITLPLKITRMLLTLHGGYTFGKTIGQILVVLTGLSLILLAGTGLVTFFTRTIGKRRVAR